MCNMWKLISIRDLERYQKEGQDLFLVDMRSHTDFAAGHIPGAVNHPNIEDYTKQLPRNRLIVLYCYHGSNSMIAARKLSKQGFQSASICGGFQSYLDEKK